MINCNKLRLAIAGLALALLAGCQGVVATHPLPQATLGAAAQARFAGTWVLRVGQGAAYTVAFSCDGTAHIASTDWDGRKFQFQQGELIISRGAHSADGSGFLSLGEHRKGKPPAYAFMRYRFLSEEDVVLWAADPAPFNAAIKDKKLKGTADQRQVEITSAPRTLLEFLDDPANHPLFDYQNPLVLRKVAGPMNGKPGAECAKK